MSKIQTICCLVLFLFIIFSMDMIFGNMVRESFRGGGGGVGGGGLGRGLNGPGAGLGRGLGLGLGVTALKEQQLVNYNSSAYSDDQPFYYSFPFINQIQ